MKVILVQQVRKILRITEQPLFGTSYRFLLNFVYSIILGYYLVLLAAIIPKLSWIKEIRPIKT